MSIDNNDIFIPAKLFKERIKFLKNEQKRLNTVNPQPYENFLSQSVEMEFERMMEYIMCEINTETEKLQTHIEIYIKSRINFPVKYNDGIVIPENTINEKKREIRKRLLDTLIKLGYYVNSKHTHESYETWTIDWNNPIEYKPDDDLK